MSTINDLQCGKAGEYLVCADLIIKGYISFPSEQGLHYDVICDYSGRLLRIQVKTTREPMTVPQRANITKKYLFHVRRMGKGGRKAYEATDVDIFALVALDTKEIGYIRSDLAKSTMFFLPGGTLPVKDAGAKKELIINLKKEGLSYVQIQKQTGADLGYIYRVVAGKENRSWSKSYLQDFKFEDCL